MSYKKKTPATKLFPESSDDEADDDKKISSPQKFQNNNKIGQGQGFQINKNYAERYDKWRTGEEMMKMKARYGTTNVDELGSDESSSSLEEEWTDDKEKSFFKALSNLKKKDPKIYDPNVRFFSQDADGETPSTSKSQQTTEQKRKQKEKPFLLKDHERTMILETGGLVSDHSDDEDASKKPETLSYYQELDSIKKGFSKALKDIDSDDEEGPESDNLLLKKSKPKSEDEKKQDDKDYRLWLKGEIHRLESGKLSKDEERELTFLRSYWNDDKLDEGEKFLRDYILNRKYVETEEDSNYTPSYNEIVHDSDEGLSTDEQFETQREEFEHKYNFRFEEPDPEFIKRFPRTVEESLRREDERRKKQRGTARERKKEAKDRKREEVERLKSFKMDQILNKLKQLQEVSGDPDLPLEDQDIDGDFDPEEYDRRMKKVFSEKYYEEAEGEEKPQFAYDPEIDDEVNWDEWIPTEDDEPAEATEVSRSGKKSKQKTKTKDSAEDGSTSSPIVESTETDEAVETTEMFSNLKNELIALSKGKSKKKKSAFLEVLEKKKPKFDPEVHKTFEQYFKEYYALEFEDLIGDLPCRFKYRKVAANDFGLSTDEILKAADRELNQWASLKKTYQYRAEEEEKFEAQAYKKKAENEKLKKRVLLSLYQPKTENDSDDDDDNSHLDSETKQKSTSNGDADVGDNPETNGKKSKKKRKRNKNKNKQSVVKEESVQEDIDNLELRTDNQADEELTQTIETLSEEPKKSKSKKKSKQKHDESPPQTELQPISEDKSNSSKPNDAKRKKKESFKEFGANQSGKKKNKHNDLKRKADVDVEDDRLKAYGLNPKKYKKWVKYGGASK